MINFDPYNVLLAIAINIQQNKDLEASLASAKGSFSCSKTLIY